MCSRPKQRKETELLQKFKASCCIFDVSRNPCQFYAASMNTSHRMAPTPHALAAAAAGAASGLSRDARKQLTCQSRNCQPQSLRQCKTTGNGHHPINQANLQPQRGKQLCILQNLLAYFLGHKCGFTFHFIQLQLIKSRHNFSDVITHGLINKYSQFSNSLKTDYETNYHANKHMRH